MDTAKVKSGTSKEQFSELKPSIVNQESELSRSSDTLGQYGQNSGQHLFDRSCTQNAGLPKTESAEEQSAFKDYITITVSDLLNPSLKLNSIAESRLNLVLEIKDVEEVKQLQEMLLVQSEIKFIDKIQGLDLKKLRVDGETGEVINGLLMTISQNQWLFPHLNELRIGNVKQDTSFKIMASLGNFRVIIIGDVGCNAILEISDKGDNLKGLRIGDVARSACIRVLNSLSGLVSLTIGDLARNAIVELSASFNNIKRIFIGKVGKEVTLKLPEHLDSLEDLTIDDIWSEVLLNLSVSMNGLKKCTLGYIGTKATVIFPDRLESLIQLNIGDIFQNAEVKLPTLLSSLKELSIGDIWQGVRINFPKIYDGLKSLVYGKIYDSVILEILEALRKYIDGTDLEKTKYSQRITSLHESMENSQKALDKPFIDPAEIKVNKSEEESFKSEAVTKVVTQRPSFLQLDLIRACSADGHPADKDGFITITVVDLLNPSLKFNCGLEDRLSLILEVNSITEINQLMEVLSKQSEIKFMDKIHGLDFKDLTIDGEASEALNQLLAVIWQNLFLFPRLIELHIGNIRQGTSFKIVASLSNYRGIIIGDIGNNAVFELSDTLDNVENLAIGNIGIGVKFTLFQSFPRLRDLRIGNVAQNASVRVLNSLNELVAFSIGDIARNAIVELIALVNNIKRISIGKIGKEAVLKLPGILDSLEELIVSDIWSGVMLNLSVSMRGLKRCIIGYISAESTVIFPDRLESLMKLSFGDIFQKAVVKLPTSLSSLEELSIGDIWQGVTINIPRIHSGLKILVYGKIYDTQISEVLDLLKKYVDCTDLEVRILASLYKSSLDSQKTTAECISRLQVAGKALFTSLSDLGKTCIERGGEENIRQGIMCWEKSLEMHVLSDQDRVEVLEKIATAYYALKDEESIRKGVACHMRVVKLLEEAVPQKIQFLQDCFSLPSTINSNKDARAVANFLKISELSSKDIETYNLKSNEIRKDSIIITYLELIDNYQKIAIITTKISTIYLNFKEEIDIFLGLKYREISKQNCNKLIEIQQACGTFRLNLGGKKNLENGLAILSQALDLKVEMSSRNDWDLADLIHTVGVACKLLGGDVNVQKGSRFLEISKKMQEKLTFEICFGGGILSPYLISNIIGHIYLELGGKENLRRSLWHIKEALRIRAIIPGNNSYVVTLLNYLGTIYYRLGGKENLLSALHIFKECLKMQQALSFDDDAIMISLFNIGVVYQDLEGVDNLKEGLNYLNDSFSICQNLDDPYMLTILLNRIGRAYRDLDGTDNIYRGIKCLEEALKRELEYLGNDPGIARSLSGLAKAYLKFGDAEKALEYRKQAYSMYLAIFGKDYKALQELKLEIEKRQADFFKEEGSGTLSGDFGGNKIGSESRWIIFSRGKIDDKYLEIKQKIQKPLLDEIAKIVSGMDGAARIS